jgi:hypothetical protein
MFKSLKFCVGSVAKKDFVPELKHFAIAGGRVRGFNGILALSSPIPFDIDCNPRAEPLVKAIMNCTDTILLSMTKAGRLMVKSGVFKVSIDCVIGDTHHVEPEGKVVNFDGELLLKGFKAVSSFIGDDASRTWTNGVLVKGQSMFATNNVMLVEYWLDAVFPSVVNIPRAAVREMLRINEAPIFAQVTDNSITFHYSDDRWLRTQLLVTTWPDLAKILNQASRQLPFNDALFAALENVKPFVDKTGGIYFEENEIRTHIDENEGAAYTVPDLQGGGKYNIDMLNLLKGTAKTIDWSSYPGACLFQGDRLRGAVIGIKR